MDTTSIAPEFVRFVIYIVILLGANVGYNYLLHRIFNNSLLISIMSYFGFFITFMIIYFMFFGFEFKTLFGFSVAFAMSVLIAIFLMIVMSPTYCNKEEGSNMGIYIETLLYGLLIYLIYFYLTTYVIPFYNNLGLHNNINRDLIFFGIVATLFTLIFIINSFVKSKPFDTINFYTLLGYLFVLSMKIYVIFNQSFQPPQVGGYYSSGNGNMPFSSSYSSPYYSSPLSQAGGYGGRLVREPDYLKPQYHRKRIKSSFYDFK